MSKSKSYTLTDDGLDRLNSAIDRAFNNQKSNLNDREDIYRSQRSSSYNYFQLKKFLEKYYNFKIGDETLKFILERTAGVKVKTIESIFNVLTESFSNSYIEFYQNRAIERSKNTLKYHNLPVRSCPHFVGRTTEIEEVLESIRLDKIHPQIVVIKGKSGIGKTALVTEIAYRCHEHGEHSESTLLAYQVIIYVDFQKKYKDSIFNGAINNIFRVISQTIKDDSIIRTEEENRREKTCNALKNYKTLLIIDNFQNIKEEEKHELSDFLVSLPNSTKVIITTQVPIMMVHQIELKSMVDEEIKEIMDGKLKQCDKNFDIDPAPYVGNPLTAVAVVVNMMRVKLLNVF
jgi:archaellum biogenesis ATPase FlaH